MLDQRSGKGRNPEETLRAVPLKDVWVGGYCPAWIKG